MVSDSALFKALSLYCFAYWIVRSSIVLLRFCLRVWLVLTGRLDYLEKDLVLIVWNYWYLTDVFVSVNLRKCNEMENYMKVCWYRFVFHSNGVDGSSHGKQSASPMHTRNIRSVTNVLSIFKRLSINFFYVSVLDHTGAMDTR